MTAIPDSGYTRTMVALARRMGKTGDKDTMIRSGREALVNDVDPRMRVAAAARSGRFERKDTREAHLGPGYRTA